MRHPGKLAPAVAPLKEEGAHPAEPEPGYGWEKLFAEELCLYSPSLRRQRYLPRDRRGRFLFTAFVGPERTVNIVETHDAVFETVIPPISRRTIMNR